jgi:hypothetical protein
MSTILYLVTALGILTVFIFYAFTRGRKNVFRPLYREFKRKIWMTCSLGLIFFFLYFFIVWIGAYFAEQTEKSSLFFLFYEHPIEWIYIGLSIFACFSLMIYFVRMLVKYVYTLYGKDF